MNTNPPVDLRPQGAPLAVTGVATTDIFTSASPHGLNADDVVVFLSKTAGAGVNLLTNYFVIATNLAASTFSLSATQGGGILDLTSDMTAPSTFRRLNAYKNSKKWFTNDDLAWLAKYVQASQGATIADNTVFPDGVLADFYINRRLPA
jgi:hypothetical protein